MIPFGYRIADAKAMVDPEEARVLKDFFRRFTAGGEVKAAAEEAGLRMAPANLRGDRGLPGHNFHGAL